MTAPAPEKAAPIPADVRLWWFLFVLNACGDYGSYANDDPGEWVAAFCDDVEPTDTFNRACDLTLATCTHNSMDETSRVWITEAGKRFLADRASQEENPRPAKTGGLETAVLRQPQEERIREKADDTRLPLDVEWEERIREDEPGYLVRIAFREGRSGGLRISSPDVPGLILSHHDEPSILADMVKVLREADRARLRGDAS